MAKTKSRPGCDCLSIIICENVIEDARSHNKTIVNVFNRILSQKFPAVHPQLTVFASLTSGHGEMPLTVSLGQVGKKPLVEIAGTVKFPGPRAVVDLIFNFRGITFLEPGEYEAVVSVKGEILSRRRLVAALVKRPEGRQT